MTQMNNEEQQGKRILESIMNNPLPDELNERMEKAVQTFRENLPGHPYICQKERNENKRYFSRRFRSWNLAWVAGFVFLVLIPVYSLLFAGSTPSWADVTRQFKSIPFFHATVYAKKLTDKHAVQFEIWMGEGGKIRLRYGSQVVFAGKAGIVKTYDIIKRRTIKPADEAEHVIGLLNSAETFSLETVIQTVTGNMADLRPLTTRVEGVSADLSTFDLSRDNSSEEIRIWALRESLLPIQLQQKNKDSGESIDVFFSYLKQQPDSFFDPEVFEKQLRDFSTQTSELLDAFP